MGTSGTVNGDGEDNELVAAINVTPLVDVMLVLLVIFMVTAPMMQQGVEVKLPKATTAPLEGKSEQVVLSITREGEVFLGSGNRVEVDTIPEKVAAVMEARPEEERKIYIKGDSELNYGLVMEVMGKLHEGGIHQIGLISAPVDGPKKASNEKPPVAVKKAK